MTVGIIFIHPAFLWGLVAVLIPVAVHLFNFRRYRTVYFSNVDRLSELHNEQRRRSEVRRWLVLAARVLAIVFLVLAFAHPVIPTAGSRQQVSGSTAVSVYIDNSFSMESASTDGSLLDLARRKGREVVEAHGRGARYQLLTADLAGHEMRWLSSDEMLEALDAIEPSPAAPLMSTVAARQAAFLRQSGAAAPYAYLVSDFQQSTADLDALPSDSIVSFTLVPLAGVESDNIYIDTVTLDAPAYFIGGSVSATVTLRNSGGRTAEKVPVKLYVDGRERAVTTLDIEADAPATATLHFTLDHAGWLDGTVTVEDYPVTFDDSYYFTLLAGEPVGVLEVDGDRPNGSLDKLFSHDSAVHYRSQRHLPPMLTDWSFIVLNEVGALSSGEVQQLTEWVDEGGSLLVVPPAGGAEGLNTLLTALQAPTLGSWKRHMVRAATIDYDNSLYRGVFAGKTDEMEMPTVQGRYTPSGRQAVRQPVITLADGSDMLTVTPAGNGRLYLFTLPLTAEWTDFTAQALFVPTIYNMALYSRPLPPSSHTLGDPAPVTLQGTYDLDRQMPHLTGPGTDGIPDLRRVGNRQVLIPHDELTAAGIYRLEGADRSSDEHLAFNYPRRESEMRYFTRDAVARAVAGRAEYSVVRHSAKPLDDELRERNGGHPLWRLCLLAALLMLAAETALLKLKIKN